MQALTLIFGTLAMLISFVHTAPALNSTISNSTSMTQRFSYDTILPRLDLTSETHIGARSAPICENCMSCTAKQKGIKLVGYSLRYTLHIGAPFIDGAGCGSVERGMAEDPELPDIFNFKCEDDGFGMTMISFTVTKERYGWEISKYFNRAYTSVEGTCSDGFNCPQY